MQCGQATVLAALLIELLRGGPKPRTVGRRQRAHEERRGRRARGARRGRGALGAILAGTWRSAARRWRPSDSASSSWIRHDGSTSPVFTCNEHGTPVGKHGSGGGVSPRAACTWASPISCSGWLCRTGRAPAHGSGSGAWSLIRRESFSAGFRPRGPPDRRLVNPRVFWTGVGWKNLGLGGPGGGRAPDRRLCRPAERASIKGPADLVMGWWARSGSAAGRNESWACGLSGRPQHAGDAGAPCSGPSPATFCVGRRARHSSRSAKC